MPTTTVKTIGSTGDYSTLQAWEDAAPANLVTSIFGGEIWEGQCQNQVFDGGSGSAVVISGSTTDATGYKHLTTVSGASFRQNANVETNALRYNSSNGAAITSAHYANPVVHLNEASARMTGLQVRNTNGGAASRAIQVGDNSVRINGVIAETAGSTGFGVILQDGGDGFVLTNSLLVMRGASANRILAVSFSPTIVNCTLVVPSGVAAATDGIGIAYPTSAVVRNTAVFGVANIGPTTGTTYTTCFTDESTSLPSGVTTTAYATGSGAQFENISDGTHDYRIKTGSSLRNAGTTDATFGTPSINNQTRPQGASYDVGSWEFAEAPATPFLTSPTATVNGTTTAAVGATVPIATGTLRAVITNSTTVPSTAQVIAGQDHTGSTSGVLSGSLAITSAGVKTFNILGLTSGTTRHVYLALEDTGGNSAVVYGGVIYPGTWRVASDVTTTGWVITGAATHAAAINEDTAGDAAFTTSPALTSTPSSLTLQLDEPRPAGTYTERIRVNVSSGTGFARVVALNDAGTVQGQTADQAITSTLTTYSLFLTQTGTATRLRLDVWI